MLALQKANDTAVVLMPALQSAVASLRASYFVKWWEPYNGMHPVQ